MITLRAVTSQNFPQSGIFNKRNNKRIYFCFGLARGPCSYFLGFPMYTLRNFANFTRKQLQFRPDIISAPLSYERGRSVISVEPSSSLIDDEVRIHVSG